MRIHLIAVGCKPPAWVAAGFQEYARRLPRECALALTEVVPVPRRKGVAAERARREEGRRLLQAVPTGAHLIALDERGAAWSTRELARRLERWRLEGRPVALLVGGADGLDGTCLERAETCWSLSPLTLPHYLVRVLVAEQLYRAWSLGAGHPYHRV